MHMFNQGDFYWMNVRVNVSSFSVVWQYTWTSESVELGSYTLCQFDSHHQKILCIRELFTSFWSMIIKFTTRRVFCFDSNSIIWTSVDRWSVIKISKNTSYHGNVLVVFVSCRNGCWCWSLKSRMLTSASAVAHKWNAFLRHPATGNAWGTMMPSIWRESISWWYDPPVFNVCNLYESVTVFVGLFQCLLLVQWNPFPSLEIISIGVKFTPKYYICWHLD